MLSFYFRRHTELVEVYHQSSALRYIRTSSPLHLFLVAMLFTSSVFAQDCGEKRWAVKTLSDFDTSLVDFSHVVETTVHQQTKIPKPAHEYTFRNKSEDTVYTLTCYIIAFKKQEDDKDIHIIIQDTKTDDMMVAEVVSSDCLNVKKTSRYLQMKKLDEWFVANIGRPETKFTYLHKPILVRITGVGFFDTEHGQKGMSMNGREIHPVLSIKLLKK